MSHELCIEDFVKNGQINITKSTIKKLKKQFPDIRKQIADGVQELVDSGKLHYPYKKHTMSKNFVLETFEKLRNSKHTITNISFVVNRLIGQNIELLYEGQPTLIIMPKDDYYVFGSLTDYFQETVRVKCRRNDQTLSSYAYWKKYAYRVADACYDIINNDTLRHELFNQHYEVGTFRLSIAKYIIERYRAKHILDPCAGWGDRLIASLACNVDSYTGFDPNNKLFKGYTHICDMFNESSDVNVICQPFETSENRLTKNKYDLVFTCPPYFDLEIYDENDPKQSINRYPLLNNWLSGFLFPMLELAWKYLIPGGYFVVVINDCRSHYVKRMIDHINQMDSKYLGCIGYAKDQTIGDDRKFDSPQPIWVWYKPIIN